MSPDHRDFTDPKRALQLGVGLASPLWSTFFVAASAGMAFWAWNRWAHTAAAPGVGEAGPAPRRLAPSAPEPEPGPDLTAPPAPTEETPVAALVTNDASARVEAAPVVDPVTEAPVLTAAPVVKPVARAKAPAKPVAKKAAPAKDKAPTVQAKPARVAKAPSVRKGKAEVSRSPRASVRRKARNV